MQQIRAARYQAYEHVQLSSKGCSDTFFEATVLRDHCNHFQRLKHYVATRWHSTLAAMSAYMCGIDTIDEVVEEQKIRVQDVPILSTEQQDILAVFVTIRDMVRRIARQLEAYREDTLSKALRLLRD